MLVGLLAANWRDDRDAKGTTLKKSLIYIYIRHCIEQL